MYIPTKQSPKKKERKEDSILRKKKSQIGLSRKQSEFEYCLGRG